MDRLLRAFSRILVAIAAEKENTAGKVNTVVSLCGFALLIAAMFKSAVNAVLGGSSWLLKLIWKGLPTYSGAPYLSGGQYLLLVLIVALVVVYSLRICSDQARL